MLKDTHSTRIRTEKNEIEPKIVADVPLFLLIFMI